MNQKSYGERNVNYDILRIIACIFVICCHVSTINVENFSIGSKQWISAHVFNGVGHTGSILFLFISGALLLDERYDFKPKKFYLNNFLKMLVAYQLWVILYNVIGVIQRGNFGWPYWKDVIINSIAGNACYHFWYVPVLLGIYLILPMLRAICKADKWIPVYFVALFFVVQILFGAILSFDFKYKYLLDYLLHRIPVTLVNHYVGYFVMGYVLARILKENKIKKPLLLGVTMFAGGIIFGLFADLYLSLKAGVTLMKFNDIYTLSSCLSAVGMFLIINCKKINLQTRGCGVVRGVAALTFGIYMIHPLFMEQIIQFWEYMDFIPEAVLIPILVMLLFAISIIPIWILSKIPIVNEWFLFCGRKKKGTVM